MGDDKVVLFSKFIEYLNSVTVLDFKANNLTKRGIEGVCAIYQSFRIKINKIFLDKNPLNKAGIELLSNSFNQSYLKKLSLQGCNKEPNGIRPLFMQIDKMKSIEYLDVSFNLVNDLDIRILTKNFKNLPNLISLNLSNNNITFIGIREIISYIHEIGKLEAFELNLSYNNFKSKGFHEISKLFLKNILQFGFLILDNNGSGDEGVTHIFDSLKLSCSKKKRPFIIDTLSLESNEITDIGFKKMIDYFNYLKKNNLESGIARINFKFNQIKDDQCEYKLKFAIENCSKVNFSSEKFIKLSYLQEIVNCFYNHYIKPSENISFHDFSIYRSKAYFPFRKNSVYTFENNKSIHIITEDEYETSKINQKNLYTQLKSFNTKFVDNLKIIFLPRLKIGEKMIKIENLEIITQNKTKSLESLHGKNNLFIFTQDTPFSTELIKDFKILLNLSNYKKEDFVINLIIIGSKNTLRNFHENINEIDSLIELNFYALDYFKYKESCIYKEVLDLNFENPIVIIANSEQIITYRKEIIPFELVRIMDNINIDISPCIENILDSDKATALKKSLKQYQKSLKSKILKYKFDLSFKYLQKIELDEDQNIKSIKVTDFEIECYLREKEMEEFLKFYSALLKDEQEYNRIKINKKTLKLIDVKKGVICNNCKTGISKMKQYYCYWCDIHYCLVCSSFKNIESKSFHHHNLIFIPEQSNSEFDKFDENKLGKNHISKFLDKVNLNLIQHKVTCNSCNKLIGCGLRFTCLNCFPGKISSIGLIDFCEECFEILSDINNKMHPEFSQRMENISSHKIEHHVLRVIYSLSNYFDY